MRLITKLFESQSAVNPSNRALTFRDLDFTYQQINETANQFAAFLLAKGVKIEDKIGIAVDRSPEMLIALLGILKAGAAYVPLDPEYPHKRIEYMLGDSSAKILLTSKKYQGKFRSAATEILIEDVWPALTGYPDSNIETALTGDNLAYIIYTSGSTGVPKGVQIEHHSLHNLLQSMQTFPGITDKDKLLAVTTISFDISILELFLPLISGAQVIITDSVTTKDGIALLDIIVKQNITYIQATPFTYKMMLEAGWNDKLPLKVLCGGEALPKDLAQKLAARCKALYNMYGPTETTIYSTGKQIRVTDELITIGKPIDNTTVYILDEKLKPVAPGEMGEIAIAGEGVARGYFNKPGLTHEKFIDDKLSAHGKGLIYRTGDLGRVLPNGEIECFGRMDSQVKIKGYRIELTEIEYLLRKQKDILEAVVISPKNTDGHTRLIAYVITDFEDKLGAEAKAAIQRWKQVLQNELPSFMLPNEIVLLSALPLTENGKIDRNTLSALDSPTNITSSYVAPTNNLEQLITDIWQEYLGVDNIGINDTFFELGGHSLIAVRIITRIEIETGKRIRLAELLEYDTPKRLAELLQKGAKSAIISALVPIKPQGNKVPLYIVHGNGSTAFKFINFAQQLDAEQPVYGLQAIGIDGFKEPFDNVEDIAATYVDEVLRQNPDGPYSLSGYSFGGIIAFEMARQLIAKGKKVSMLAMLEGYVIKNYQLDPGFYKNLYRVWWRIRKFVFGFYLLGKEPKRTLIFKTDTIKSRINNLFGRTVLQLQYKQDEVLTHIFRVAAVHQNAVEKYKLKPYNGEIYVFRAKKRSFFIHDFNNLGWKPYATSVKVFDVDGEHSDIFDAPQNVDFARKLQQCLDHCNREFNK